MSRVDKRLIFAAAALLMIFSAMTSSAAVTPAGGACDVAADVALEVGDYATAIRLHQSLLLSDRNNALAHYHLGFAYGMAGLTAEEIGEYRTAIALGLKKWDDAAAENQFSGDEYLIRERPRSFLFLPLEAQRNLTGALYLENALAPRAFGSEKLAALELLSSQAALSLRAAALGADLMREIKERVKAEAELEQFIACMGRLI